MEKRVIYMILFFAFLGIYSFAINYFYPLQETSHYLPEQSFVQIITMIVSLLSGAKNKKNAEQNAEYQYLNDETNKAKTTASIYKAAEIIVPIVFVIIFIIYINKKQKYA